MQHHLVISVKVKVIAQQNHFEHLWIVISLLLVKHTMHVTPLPIEIKINVIDNSKKTWKSYARKKIWHFVMQLFGLLGMLLGIKAR